MKRLTAVSAMIAAMLLPQSSFAGEAWEEIKAAMYEGKTFVSGDALINVDMPYRSKMDPRTLLGADLHAPLGEVIESVTLIIDNNPMPVSAIFDLSQPQNTFSFDATMRMNGQSPVRILMETNTGSIYMTETYVKTYGQGACAAPPATDPHLALETLGQMEFAVVEEEAAAPLSKLTSLAKAKPAINSNIRAEISIMHPSHSGMQKDQITLLYLPHRYVETVEVNVDGAPYFTLTGSISLSENPALDFDVPMGTGEVSVHLVDTEGAEFDRVFHLGQS